MQEERTSFHRVSDLSQTSHALNSLQARHMVNTKIQKAFKSTTPEVMGTKIRSLH